jgi:hypothetical protein
MNSKDHMFLEYFVLLPLPGRRLAVEESVVVLRLEVAVEGWS